MGDGHFFIMSVRSSEIIWMDSLIIDIGILSKPVAFPQKRKTVQ